MAAEATFWSVACGLEQFIKQMGYDEVRKFKPLEEANKPSRFGVLLNKVSNKLKGPAWSYEASYALGQAAWAIYAKENSVEVMQEQQARYDERESKGSSNRM